MHADRLPESLPDLWRVWGRMAGIALEKGPTPGHRAIARLGAPVITQNIDGLHQAAGSEIVAELHGTALDAICLDPQCRWRARLTPGTGSRAQDHGVPESCPRCGAQIGRASCRARGRNGVGEGMGETEDREGRRSEREKLR